mmetsp:Transcript_19898/g.62421  ORF Transcript_19898/g.62421 Transcript_19898/m.62421 type:complete len:268 (-) Transcript_19898:288-1091(-)
MSCTMRRRLARFSLVDETRKPWRDGSNRSLGTARHRISSQSPVDLACAPGAPLAPVLSLASVPSSGLAQRRWYQTSARPSVMTKSEVASNISRVRARAASVGSVIEPRAPTHKSSSKERPSNAHSNCCRSTKVLTRPAEHWRSGTAESSTCGYEVPAARKSSLTRKPRARSQSRTSSAKQEPRAVTSRLRWIGGARGIQPCRMKDSRPPGARSAVRPGMKRAWPGGPRYQSTYCVDTASPSPAAHTPAIRLRRPQYCKNSATATSPS